MRVEEISTWVEDARKAFASASDLDSLKAARLAHAGDKSPIALASRGLGSLSPEDKASFGKLIGDAKAAIADALAQATAILEAERDRKSTSPCRSIVHTEVVCIQSQSLKMKSLISSSSRDLLLKKALNLNQDG
jgi:phenylalanyl-tRNA synthetase alpha subunit